MVLTPSSMLALGTPLPPFSLPEPAEVGSRADPRTSTQRTVSSSDFGGRPLLVVFLCNHCPYVKHVKTEYAKLGNDLAQLGVAMVGISSNDIEAYPADAPDKMAEDKRNFGYSFPYLFDAEQNVAAAFRAACTPEHYLFDAEHRLVYRGQLDDSRPNNGKPVTGRDVRAAVSALLAGKPVSSEQIASIGCNIKWRPGREPSY
jgi:peroxiredoxin